MLKTLSVGQAVALGLGVIAGAAVCYTAYRLYQKKVAQRNQEPLSEQQFAAEYEAIRAREEKTAQLLAGQTFVEVLTTKELTAWFRENRDQFGADVKMVIAQPTREMLLGLGCAATDEIDLNSSILQYFYDETAKSALKLRLVSYGEINSNLQAHLLEEDGLIVVTD